MYVHETILIQRIEKDHGVDIVETIIIVNISDVKKTNIDIQWIIIYCTFFLCAKGLEASTLSESDAQPFVSMSDSDNVQLNGIAPFISVFIPKRQTFLMLSTDK